MHLNLCVFCSCFDTCFILVVIVPTYIRKRVLAYICLLYQPHTVQMKKKKTHVHNMRITIILIKWNLHKIQYNLNGSNTDGSFTVDDSNLQNSSNSSRKQIFRDFFLFYHGIVCFMYSLESPHRGDSNEYTQYTIIVWKIQKISLNYRYLLPELVP